MLFATFVMYRSEESEDWMEDIFNRYFIDDNTGAPMKFLDVCKRTHSHVSFPDADRNTSVLCELKGILLANGTPWRLFHTAITLGIFSRDYSFVLTWKKVLSCLVPFHSLEMLFIALVETASHLNLMEASSLTKAHIHGRCVDLCFWDVGAAMKTIHTIWKQAPSTKMVDEATLIGLVASTSASLLLQNHLVLFYQHCDLSFAPSNLFF